jgi:hypothetical protein
MVYCILMSRLTTLHNSTYTSFQDLKTCFRCADMRLYEFGYNTAYRTESAPSNYASPNSFTPISVFHAKEIKVLWISWCDSIVAYRDDADIWTIKYRGTGLTTAQKDHIVRCEKIKNAVKGSEKDIEFFGSAMHDGLRGYVVYGASQSGNEVVVFSTDLEAEAGFPALRFHRRNEGHNIKSIRMSSDESCLISAVNDASDVHLVVHSTTLDGMQEVLVSTLSSSHTMADFHPVQWLVNSTTATALGIGGQVYTATLDPRYSNCLGRAYNNTADFVPIDYLSETVTESVASGGYMSAVVSSEGELFVWGQANPGSDKILSVLKEDASSFDKGTAATAVTIADDDQDDMVKCLKVRIDGDQAWVYIVAIGHGHLLVAAEVRKGGCAVKRAVLCAGVNSKGQLGLGTERDFVEEFEEIAAFRNLKIEQMVAAGWSTLVVTAED